MQTFEEYLMTHFLLSEGIVDEEKIDDQFLDWRADLDIEEVIEFCNEYGKKMYQQGNREAVIAESEMPPLTQQDLDQLTLDKRQEEAEQAIRSDIEVGNVE